MDQGLFDFFISGEKNQVYPDSCLWQFPLSGKNTGIYSDSHPEHTTKETIITIGDYFLAASRFLSGNDFEILKSGLKTISNIYVQTDQICRITLFLEKHGAFYHPLKIQVALSEPAIFLFVLNGAVSKPGLSLIKNEYQLMVDLNKIYPKSYIPKVFGMGTIITDKARIGFFLGEWFKGYKEFHATKDQGVSQIIIWESDGSGSYISEANAFPIYREISRILTYYYDIETFEQIFPWHHAAGDFIVRYEGDRAHVKLITVRGYTSLTKLSKEEDKNVYILPALLLFFLRLTLKIRLDRLNGIGRTIMLGRQVLNSSIEGFLSALDEKFLNYEFGDLRFAFVDFFRQFNLEQITGLLEKILEPCHFSPLEKALIDKNFISHCRFLLLFFKTI